MVKKSEEKGVLAPHTPEKSIQQPKGIDTKEQTWKKPEVKKPKVKKYWPKVLDEVKPKKNPKPSTPKPCTPKPSKRATSRRCLDENMEDVGEDSLSSASTKLSKHVQIGGQNIDPTYVPESTKRALSFNVQNHERDSGKDARIIIHQYRRREKKIDKSPCDAKAIEQSEEVDLMVKNSTGMTSGFTLTECIQPTQLCETEIGATNYPLDINQRGCCSHKSLVVYKRVFRANKCPSSSRKLGPNFPSLWKKRRIMRRKATIFDISKYVIAALMEGTIMRQKQTNFGSRRSAKSAKQAQKRVKRSKFPSIMSERQMVVQKENDNRGGLLPRYAGITISPTKSQRSAANEPSPFQCLLSLTPLAMSKKRRSNKTIRRHNLGPLTLIPSINQLPSVPFPQSRHVRVSNEDLLSIDYDNIAAKRQSIIEFLDNAVPIDKEVQGCPKYVRTSTESNCEKEVPGCPEFALPSTESNYEEEVQGCPKHVLPSTEGMQDVFPVSLMDVIEGPEGLHISDAGGQLVVHNQNAHGKVGQQKALIVYKKRKPPPKVDIDQETMRVWRLLMAYNGEDVEEERDLEKDKWWEKERNIYHGRVDSFISRMHQVQGDRRFSPWKGSVVDSVVGVFLTQNVSDHLSSSAFMSLAAKYPLRSTTAHKVQKKATPRAQEATVELCASLSNCQVLPECSSHAEVNKANVQEGMKNFQEGSKVSPQTKSPSRKKKSKVKKKQEKPIDWDELRKKYVGFTDSTSDTMDSLDWEEVRQATVDEVADAIKGRGQQSVLAGRIKDFLDRVVKDHGSINLEWLRAVPPDKAKEYLLGFKGLGLKSVECVRLLALQHHAFPVDTNVGRVAVRLGWVPLKPLPESLQIHHLEQYPVLDSIQIYLLPRLCTLDQRTLYELHYQMITFGKVFCRKRKPNCNACPMRGECRHFASAFASARLALPGPQEKNTVTSIVPYEAVQDSSLVIMPEIKSHPAATFSESRYKTKSCEPIIEHPPSPEPESTKYLERDIEDLCDDPEDYIPTIRLDVEGFRDLLQECIEMNNNPLKGVVDMSKALVALTSEAASIPLPKLKDISLLRTIHHVYELPDSHPILAGFDTREPDDPSPYLLAIWPSGGTAVSSKASRKLCDSSQELQLCNRDNCSSHIDAQDQNVRTVGGTILIPCRTATRGRFPLNGTYFQVNEVFADDETSEHPLSVPRALIWSLSRRTLHSGAYAGAIFGGLSTEEIQRCFWKGFVCVRAFNRMTRAPAPLSERFHVSTMLKGKRKFTQDEQ